MWQSGDSRFTKPVVTGRNSAIVGTLRFYRSNQRESASMSTATKEPARQHARMDLLRGLRSWCSGLSVVFLALALMSLANTAGSPKTWASSFNALAASGAFVQYGGWLAALGGLFLFIALLVSYLLRRMER